MKQAALLFWFFLPTVQAQTANVTASTKTWAFALIVNVSALNCDQTALAPGANSTCTVTLDSPAPAAGFPVTPFNADSPLILATPKLTVPGGASSATFVVTWNINGDPSITSAAVHAGPKSWTFSSSTVTTITVISLNCDQTSLAVGQSSTCIVMLNAAAPAGGFPVFPYTADVPLILSPPSGLTVPAGATSITFTASR